MNEHLADIVNRPACQITEQEGRDRKRVLKWSTIWSTHISQNEQQHFNFNVLTHGAMEKMVLAERLELPTARLQIGCSTN